MNDLPKLYFTMETYLFPLQEEELVIVPNFVKHTCNFQRR